MVNLFERPCPEGHVYPCTVADLEARLGELAEDDLDGLWAVGLVPAARRDRHTYARYRCREKPTIEIYSWPATYRYRHYRHARPGRVEQDLAPEMACGMRVAKEGARYVGEWTAESARLFVVEFILLHEVGHHIHHRARRLQGLHCHSSHTDMEQFADAYAARQMRARSL